MDKDAVEESIKNFFRRVPAWSISLVLHILLMMYLGQILITRGSQESGTTFSLSLTTRQDSEESGDDGDAREEDDKESDAYKDDEEEDKTLTAVEMVEPVAGTEEAPGTGSGEEETPIAGIGPGDRASIFSMRDGGSKEHALKRWGGSAGSENAVRGALGWLSLHQDKDGKWDRNGYAKHCPADGKCGGKPSIAQSTGFDPAVTGLALLAFLGAGQTHQDGEFADVVQRSVDYLLGIQKESGCFGNPPLLYNHAICTLALAEAYGMTGDARLRGPLKHAVRFLGDSQQKAGGWDYTPNRTNRNDTSVTGWVVMALKSLQAAEVDVPKKVTFGIIRHFKKLTRSDGRVGYARESSRISEGSIAMTAVGMLGRQYLWDSKSEMLKKQAAILRSTPPNWDDAGIKEPNSMYYWYYGTLAMFQRGGYDWRFWNLQMRDMLVTHQQVSGHATGSWNPEGQWGRYGGRVYSTAISALNLEIYYRYLPLYKLEGSALMPPLKVALADDDENIKLAAIEFLESIEEKSLMPQLRLLVEDEADRVRLAAARLLIKWGDEVGASVFVTLLKEGDHVTRVQVLNETPYLIRSGHIEAIFEAMTDNEPFVRHMAAAALRKHFGLSFGFEAKASAEKRLAATTSWRRWWALRQGDASKQQVVAGAVLATSEGSDVVVVSVGTGQGIASDDLLRISRGDEYIATVVVGAVYENKAYASIAKTAPGESVAVGDFVERERRVDDPKRKPTLNKQ